MLLSTLSSQGSAILNSCQLQASSNPILSLSYWLFQGDLTLLTHLTEQWLNDFSLEWFSWPGPMWDGEPGSHLGVSLIDMEKSLSCSKVWIGLCTSEGSLMKMELFSSHVPSPPPFFFSSPDVVFVHAVLYRSDLCAVLVQLYLNLSESSFHKQNLRSSDTKLILPVLVSRCSAVQGSNGVLIFCDS